MTKVFKVNFQGSRDEFEDDKKPFGIVGDYESQSNPFDRLVCAYGEVRSERLFKDLEMLVKKHYFLIQDEMHRNELDDISEILTTFIFDEMKERGETLRINGRLVKLQK